MMTVIVPAARQGILTGMILGVARIAGETAPLLFTSFNNQFWATKLSEPTASLPVMIYTHAISPYDDWHRQAWAAGLVLLVLVLVANIACRWVCPAEYPHKEDITCDMGAMPESVKMSETTAPPTPMPPPVRAGNRISCKTQAAGDESEFLLRRISSVCTISTCRVPEKRITALIGPSGCGKSTFLAHAEPHQRNGQERALRRSGAAGRPECSGIGRHQAAPPRRHGVSTPQPVSRNRFSTTSRTASK